MNLEILTPEKKLFSAEVYGVQLPGVDGLFEVLDRHAPLVSALKAGRVKVLKDKNNHLAFFTIQSGFVEVIHNKVTVLVEGAVRSGAKVGSKNFSIETPARAGVFGYGAARGLLIQLRIDGKFTIISYSPPRWRRASFQISEGCL